MIAFLQTLHSALHQLYFNSLVDTKIRCFLDLSCKRYNDYQNYY